jgi:hypothetical protein
MSDFLCHTPGEKLAEQVATICPHDNEIAVFTIGDLCNDRARVALPEDSLNGDVSSRRQLDLLEFHLKLKLVGDRLPLGDCLTMRDVLGTECIHDVQHQEAGAVLASEVHSNAKGIPSAIRVVSRM